MATVWMNFQYIIISDTVCVQLLSRADSLQPHGLYPARLLCSRNFPGKNTRVGCFFCTAVDLPDPGIEPASLVSPTLAGGFFTTRATGKPISDRSQMQKTTYYMFPFNVFELLQSKKKKKKNQKIPPSERDHFFWICLIFFSFSHSLFRNSLLFTFIF